MSNRPGRFEPPDGASEIGETKATANSLFRRVAKSLLQRLLLAARPFGTSAICTARCRRPLPYTRDPSHAAGLVVSAHIFNDIEDPREGAIQRPAIGHTPERGVF